MNTVLYTAGVVFLTLCISVYCMVPHTWQVIRQKQGVLVKKLLGYWVIVVIAVIRNINFVSVTVTGVIVVIVVIRVIVVIAIIR